MGQTANVGTHHPWMDVLEDTNAVPLAVQPVANEDAADDFDFADGWMPQQTEDLGGEDADPWGWGQGFQ